MEHMKLHLFLREKIDRSIYLYCLPCILKLKVIVWININF